MSHRNLLLLLTAALISYVCYVRAEQNPYARYVAGGFSIIDRWALQEAPDQELFDAALEGMVDVLHKYGDTHSEFIDAQHCSDFTEEYQQEFGGVGIRLRLLGKPPMPTVIGLPAPDAASFDADVHLADRILAVDGRSTTGLDLEAVRGMVRGAVDETVTLTLLTPGSDKSRDVTLKRAVITVESVLGDLHGADGRWRHMVRVQPRIGYVRIIKFGDKTVAELGRVLADLQRDGVEGLVLDVRDNPGGPVDAAVDVSDMFLPAGRTIVTTLGRDGVERDRSVSTGSGAYPDLPMAVIVDRNSASASEIVAACLQDHRRAAIVGERSYGKGTVQRLMRIESGRSLLKLTSATYRRPSMKKIHRMPGEDESAEWGVSPDPGLEVKLPRGEYRVWRKYRERRDLLGEDRESELAKELETADGKIPEDFRDQSLELRSRIFRKSSQKSEIVDPAVVRRRVSAPLLVRLTTSVEETSSSKQAPALKAPII